MHRRRCDLCLLSWFQDHFELTWGIPYLGTQLLHALCTDLCLRLCLCEKKRPVCILAQQVYRIPTMFLISSGFICLFVLFVKRRVIVFSHRNGISSIRVTCPSLFVCIHTHTHKAAERTHCFVFWKPFWHQPAMCYVHNDGLHSTENQMAENRPRAFLLWALITVLDCKARKRIFQTLL